MHKQRNRRNATSRAGGERIFGALFRVGGKLVRCFGIVGATLQRSQQSPNYSNVWLFELALTYFFLSHPLQPSDETSINVHSR